MGIQSKPTINSMLDTDEFELPIGYTDSQGVFHKTIKLQEMTGEVEEALSEAKVRTNGGKVVTEAIAGVVESLGTMKKFTKADARNLTNVDRDFILLMNHKVSVGDEIEYQDECRKCGDVFDVNVNIDTIPVSYATEDEPTVFDVVLPTGIKDAGGNVYKKLKVSLPTGVVQERIFPMLQQNPKQAVTQMLAMITEDIEGLSHYNFETFRKMTKKDRDAISESLGKVKVGADLSPKVQCPNCGHGFQSAIPAMILLGE